MTNRADYEIARRTMQHVVDWSTSPAKRELRTQFDIFYKNRRIATVYSLDETDEAILAHMSKYG